MTIDTHGYVKALTAAGVPAAQVEALRDKVLPELATHQDLKALSFELRSEMGELKSELRSEMASIRTDMWKMSFAVVLATATLVTFLQKLLG
ncbi:MAG: hypothetical protein Q7T86_05670 [Hyphomicrobiaceae bacterium]|nr:hypothetical protein [Hyphomicrobiaceae bacterium]